MKNKRFFEERAPNDAQSYDSAFNEKGKSETPKRLALPKSISKNRSERIYDSLSPINNLTALVKRNLLREDSASVYIVIVVD